MSNEDENSVFIGNKNTMAYVFAVQTQANRFSQIKIKARGNAISKAVDVCQIALNNEFLKGWSQGTITLNTEERAKKEGDGMQRVSTIEIELVKL